MAAFSDELVMNEDNWEKEKKKLDTVFCIWDSTSTIKHKSSNPRSFSSGEILGPQSFEGSHGHQQVQLIKS